MKPAIDDRLSVVGAGGHAKVLIAAAELAGWAVERVLDDRPEKWGDRLLGHPIGGPVAPALRAGTRLGQYFVLALGDNRSRRRLATDHAIPWAIVVHPRAEVHPTARIGEGTLICAGAVVQPDARVGRHAIVNTGAVIEHDVEVGDFAHVAPGCTLTGGVRVGDGAFIGAGSTVIPLRVVGDWAVVGAGAVVTADVPARCLSVGAPNRIVRGLEDDA